jgi:quinol monooxygenase YgiN
LTRESGRFKEEEMKSIEIKSQDDVMTLINIFDVEPKDQEELVAILTTGAETLLSKQRGYIAAAIHQSQDGKHAVVYSQWRSPEDFHAARTNPAVQEYFGRVRAIATFEPITYDVTFVDHI